jgi:hypothetical protein
MTEPRACGGVPIQGYTLPRDLARNASGGRSPEPEVFILCGIERRVGEFANALWDSEVLRAEKTTRPSKDFTGSGYERLASRAIVH